METWETNWYGDVNEYMTSDGRKIYFKLSELHTHVSVYEVSQGTADTKLGSLPLMRSDGNAFIDRKGLEQLLQS